MKHSYIYQWNHWLAQFLGKCLISVEKNYLSKLLAKRYGKHAILIGVDHQYSLLHATVMPHQVLISPHVYKHHDINYIESELNTIPVASGSVDLVLLPHTLEYIENPQQLLREACRIVKPEGHIVILGFNPYGLWGLNKWFGKRKTIPWKLNFIAPNKIKQWLLLEEFKLIQQTSFLYRPPINDPKIFEKIQFLEKMGRFIYGPFGSVYLLMAQAKVIPLTPIKLNWKQRASAATLPLRSSNGYT